MNLDNVHPTMLGFIQVQFGFSQFLLVAISSGVQDRLQFIMRNRKHNTTQSRATAQLHFPCVYRRFCPEGNYHRVTCSANFLHRHFAVQTSAKHVKTSLIALVVYLEQRGRFGCSSRRVQSVGRRNRKSVCGATPGVTLDTGCRSWTCPKFRRVGRGRRVSHKGRCSPH